MIQLYNDDCGNVLSQIEDKSIDLILIDPPYNIGKAEWDKIDNYIEWLGGIFEELDRVLKDNGSFYFFHNDFLQIVELQNYINKHTEFKFKQLIVWDKYNGSEWSQLNATAHRDTSRNYSKQAEYCLFYTKQEDSGLDTIMLDVNNFKRLRRYFKDMQRWIGLNLPQINKTLGSRRAEHTFYHSSTQWDLCTKGTYQELDKHFQISQMEGYREWEDLRQEYDDLREEYEHQRYTFNNQKLGGSVWQFPVEKPNGHITPKPIALLENIIKHSSNEGDIVLDCFMGSGSTGVAAKNLGRRFIGVEIDSEYFTIAEERINGEI